MKAIARSIRIAPKKASLIAKLVRGKRVADAIDILAHTNKKGARILEQLIRSAAANASHNDSQDAQTMVVRTLTVNKAQAYHRGVPMARGRVRRMRKFLSHITVTLGVDEEVHMEKKSKESMKSKSEAKVTPKDSSDSKSKEKTSSKVNTAVKTSTKNKKITKKDDESSTSLISSTSFSKEENSSSSTSS